MLQYFTENLEKRQEQLRDSFPVNGMILPPKTRGKKKHENVFDRFQSRKTASKFPIYPIQTNRSKYLIAVPIHKAFGNINKLYVIFLQY